MTQEDYDKTHLGFTVTCCECGSTRVYFDNSLGYSATSGGWGSCDLICDECGNQTELASS
jgi:hypothetical protein